MSKRAMTAITMTFVLAACGAEKVQKSESTFVHLGQPGSTLENAALKDTLNAEEIRELSGWWLFSKQMILGHTTAAEQAKWLKGQSEDLSGQTILTSPLQVDETSRVFTLRESKNEIQLQFKPHGESYLDRQVVHISRHRQYPIVSFLRVVPETDHLQTLLFHDPKLNIDKAAEKQPARWQQKRVSIDLCGFKESKHIELAQKAVQQWAEVMRGRLEIVSRVIRSQYPPFSDLNSTCIYFDEQYQPMAGWSQHINSGRTLWNSLAFDGKNHMIDSDAFIFWREIEGKIQNHIGQETERLRNEALYSAVLHEIGHMLGLGHPPQGSSGVMAATSTGASAFSKLDLEMIQQLYPLTKP